MNLDFQGKKPCRVVPEKMSEIHVIGGAIRAAIANLKK